MNEFLFNISGNMKLQYYRPYTTQSITKILKSFTLSDTPHNFYSICARRNSVQGYEESIYKNCICILSHPWHQWQTQETPSEVGQQQHTGLYPFYLLTLSYLQSHWRSILEVAMPMVEYEHMYTCMMECCNMFKLWVKFVLQMQFS